MSEDLVVYTNTLLYILLFVFCYVRYKFRSLCTFISFLYMISSICSLFLFFFPTYDISYTSHGVVTLEAVLYQFVLYCLLILSFSYCKLDNIKTITHYNEKFIEQVQIVVVVALLIYLVYQLPLSFFKVLSGRDLSEMRDELYGDNSTGALGILTRVFGSMPYVLLIISCAKFFLFHRFSNWDKYSIALYFLFKCNVILNAISRASMAFSLMELIVLFVFFYSFVSKEMKKRILKVSIIIGPVVIGFFTMITLSRFGDYAMTFSAAMMGDFIYLPEKTACYRKTPGGAMDSMHSNPNHPLVKKRKEVYSYFSRLIIERKSDSLKERLIQRCHILIHLMKIHDMSTLNYIISNDCMSKVLYPFAYAYSVIS